MLCSLFWWSGSKARVKRDQARLQSTYIYSHTYAWVCALRWRRSTKGKHTLGRSSTWSASTSSSIISSNNNTDLSRIGIANFPVARLGDPGLFLNCDGCWTRSLGGWGQGWWGNICGCAPNVRLLLPRIGCLLCTHDSASSEPVLLCEEQTEEKT